METIQGSCNCRKVKFSTNDKINRFYICYCNYCKKDTGSSFAANLFLQNLNFYWLSGEDLIKTYNLKDSRHIKSFCSNCGSSLPTILNSQNLTMIPIGCIENDLEIKPDALIFTSRRKKWETKFKDIKEFKEFPN